MASKGVIQNRLSQPLGSKYLGVDDHTEVNCTEFVAQEDTTITLLEGGDSSVAATDVDYKASMNLDGVTLKRGALIVSPAGEAFQNINISSGSILAYNSVKKGVVELQQLFLDLFPDADAAFAFIKLRTDYTGDCIRVRRSSDDNELDIGFDANGVLDSTALSAFCGSSNGFIRTKYDQSINGNNQQQVTGLAQPKIYDGATGLLLLDGFAAASYPLDTVTNLDSRVSIGSAYVVYNTTTSSAVNYVFGTNSSGLNGLLARGSAAGVNGLTVFSGGTTTLGNAENNDRTLGRVVNNSTNTKLAINGGSLTVFPRQGNLFAQSVGNRQPDAPSFGALLGSIQFEAYFSSDQTSNDDAIKEYINNYYSIYE